MRVGVAFGGLVAAVAMASFAAPAFADTTITVRGTAFPDTRTANLSMVGCAGLFDRSDEVVQPYVALGPGTPPAGERSLKFDLAGGNAVGSVHYVASLADTTTAGLSVRAPGGATGVAYVGYQAPADVGTNRVWLGRAALSVGAGHWRTVDATGLPYAWTLVDFTTGEPVGTSPLASSKVADFMDEHGGDGAGLYTMGFGCDGKPFYIDALRIGSKGAVSTYDLEGLATVTRLTGDGRRVAPGSSVELRGSVRDGGGRRIPHATLILEEQTAAGAWKTVQVVDAGDVDPRVKVTPTRTTHYRWRFVGRPLAEGSVSRSVLVTVGLPGGGASSDPDPDGTGTTSGPAEAPDDTGAPGSTPVPTRSPDPAKGPTGTPSAVPSPSASFSAEPTDAPSSTGATESSGATGSSGPTGSADPSPSDG